MPFQEISQYYTERFYSLQRSLSDKFSNLFTNQELISPQEISARNRKTFQCTLQVSHKFKRLLNTSNGLTPENKEFVQGLISVCQCTRARLQTLAPTFIGSDAISEERVEECQTLHDIMVTVAEYFDALTSDDVVKTLSDVKTALTAELAKRWDRIKTTNATYLHQPHTFISLFCESLAALVDSEKRNSLLMPTVTMQEDVFGNKFNKFSLTQFIIADDGVSFIALDDFFDSALARIKRAEIPAFLYFATNNQCCTLTAKEETQIIFSVPLAEDYFKLARVSDAVMQDTPLKALEKLRAGLQRGDAYNHEDARQGKATATIAGPSANAALVEFNLWYEKLPIKIKNELRSLQHPTKRKGGVPLTLGWILDKLFGRSKLKMFPHPDNSEVPTYSYVNPNYCIGALGGDTATIIDCNLNKITQLSPFFRGAELDALHSRISFAVNNSPRQCFLNACRDGQSTIIRLLLTAKANIDINAVDQNNKRPIQLAAENDHIDIVLLLINAGAIIENVTVIDRPFIDWAICPRYLQVATALLNSTHITETQRRDIENKLFLNSIKYCNYEYDCDQLAVALDIPPPPRPRSTSHEFRKENYTRLLARYAQNDSYGSQNKLERLLDLCLNHQFLVSLNDFSVIFFIIDLLARQSEKHAVINATLDKIIPINHIPFLRAFCERFINTDELKKTTLTSFTTRDAIADNSLEPSVLLITTHCASAIGSLHQENPHHWFNFILPVFVRVIHGGDVTKMQTLLEDAGCYPSTSYPLLFLLRTAIRGKKIEMVQLLWNRKYFPSPVIPSTKDITHFEGVADDSFEHIGRDTVYLDIITDILAMLLTDTRRECIAAFFKLLDRAQTMPQVKMRLAGYDKQWQTQHHSRKTPVPIDPYLYALIANIKDQTLKDTLYQYVADTDERKKECLLYLSENHPFCRAQSNVTFKALALYCQTAISTVSVEVDADQWQTFSNLLLSSAVEDQDDDAATAFLQQECHYYLLAPTEHTPPADPLLLAIQQYKPGLAQLLWNKRKLPSSLSSNHIERLTDIFNLCNRHLRDDVYRVIAADILSILLPCTQRIRANMDLLNRILAGCFIQHRLWPRFYLEKIRDFYKYHRPFRVDTPSQIETAFSLDNMLTIIFDTNYQSLATFLCNTFIDTNKRKKECLRDLARRFARTSVDTMSYSDAITLKLLVHHCCTVLNAEDEWGDLVTLVLHFAVETNDEKTVEVLARHMPVSLNMPLDASEIKKTILLRLAKSLDECVSIMTNEIEQHPKNWLLLAWHCQTAAAEIKRKILFPSYDQDSGYWAVTTLRTWIQLTNLLLLTALKQADLTMLTALLTQGYTYFPTPFSLSSNVFPNEHARNRSKCPLVWAIEHNPDAVPLLLDHVDPDYRARHPEHLKRHLTYCLTVCERTQSPHSEALQSIIAALPSSQRVVHAFFARQSTRPTPRVQMPQNKNSSGGSQNTAESPQTLHDCIKKIPAENLQINKALTIITEYLANNSRTLDDNRDFMLNLSVRKYRAGLADTPSTPNNPLYSADEIRGFIIALLRQINTVTFPPSRSNQLRNIFIAWKDDVLEKFSFASRIFQVIDISPFIMCEDDPRFVALLCEIFIDTDENKKTLLMHLAKMLAENAYFRSNPKAENLLLVAKHCHPVVEAIKHKLLYPKSLFLYSGGWPIPCFAQNSGHYVNLTLRKWTKFTNFLLLTALKQGDLDVLTSLLTQGYAYFPTLLSSETLPHDQKQDLQTCPLVWAINYNPVAVPLLLNHIEPDYLSRYSYHLSAHLAFIEKDIPAHRILTKT